MFGYVSSMVFYCVYGVIFAIFFYNSVFGAEEFEFLADIVLVAFLQILGLGFNKYNFANPLRSDPYTRLIRVLRTMPIRTEHLAAARLIPVFILCAINLFMLYVPAYWIYSNVHEAITIPQLVGYLFFLYLVSVVCSCFYAYLEIGFGGRVYFVVGLIVIVVLTAVTAWLGVLDIHLGELLLQQVQEGINPLVYGASAIGTAIIIYGLWLLISRRLEHRDYYEYKAVN
jgi:hypothetical protein